jgi:hypothetical protein
MTNAHTPHSPETIDEADVKRLIQQLEQDSLSAADKKLITKVLQSYLFVASLLRETGTKVKTIRDFFSGAGNPKRP